MRSIKLKFNKPKILTGLLLGLFSWVSTLALIIDQDYFTNPDYNGKLKKLSFALPEGVLIDPSWVLTTASRAKLFGNNITLTIEESPGQFRKLKDQPTLKKIYYSNPIEQPHPFSSTDQSNFALIKLTDPINTFMPIERIRTLEHGKKTFYLSSYYTQNANNYTKNLGTATANYRSSRLPLLFDNTKKTRPYPSQMDPNNQNDVGSGIYLYDNTDQNFKLFGLLEQAESTKFKGIAIQKINAWIDQTILLDSLSMPIPNRVEEKETITKKAHNIKTILNAIPPFVPQKERYTYAIDPNWVITEKTNLRPQDVKINGTDYTVDFHQPLLKTNLQVLHLKQAITDPKLIHQRYRGNLSDLTKGTLISHNGQIAWLDQKIVAQYTKIPFPMPQFATERIYLQNPDDPDFHGIKTIPGPGIYIQNLETGINSLAGIVTLEHGIPTAILFNLETNNLIDKVILEFSLGQTTLSTTATATETRKETANTLANYLANSEQLKYLREDFFEKLQPAPLNKANLLIARPNTIMLVPNNMQLQTGAVRVSLNFNVYAETYYNFADFTEKNAEDFLSMHLLDLTDLIKSTQDLDGKEYNTLYNNWAGVPGNQRRVRFDFSNPNNKKLFFKGPKGISKEFKITQIKQLETGFIAHFDGRILLFSEALSYYRNALIKASSIITKGQRTALERLEIKGPIGREVESDEEKDEDDW